MGFFSSLSKIVQGKPVFEPNQDKAQPGQPTAEGVPNISATPTAQPPAASGPKVYPQVYIERVECQEPGTNMDCDVSIKNFSAGEVELDRIELFGKSHELNTLLRSGEAREFRVYSGPRPKTSNQTSCKIFYKDGTGDYFCSEHYIEFQQMPDQTYTINRIRFTRVQDT